MNKKDKKEAQEMLSSDRQLTQKSYMLKCLHSQRKDYLVTSWASFYFVLFFNILWRVTDDSG